MLEKQLPRRIMKYINCLSYPPSLYATHIINPFLNSRISTNYDKMIGLSANGEILIIKRDFYSIVEFLLFCWTLYLGNQNSIDFLKFQIKCMQFGYLFK